MTLQPIREEESFSILREVTVSLIKGETGNWLFYMHTNTLREEWGCSFQRPPSPTSPPSSP